MHNNSRHQGFARCALTLCSILEKIMFKRISNVILILAVLFLWVSCTGKGREATALASALERYHEEYKKYPENLQNLVPAFLPALPSGSCDHYDPTNCTYMYWWRADSSVPDLVYVYFAPFGRAVYRFGKGDWNDLG